MSAMRKPQAEPEKVKETSWKDYGIRFLFGGVITAIIGVVAKLFGPVVAGLFLAFPAILPASLTLVAQKDGDYDAGKEATGAALGSIGLIVFGAIIWLLIKPLAGIVVLVIAMVVWLAVSVLLWAGCEKLDLR